ncbi:ABC transporter ATP-binding protein [Alkalibacterium iburiense]|uniref:ABC transporter ATP-binding protein n=1 Tax=Alkalibacterium iburiense TaxID=290589 RepID=A0ABN0XN03_9LACT
MKKKSEQKYTAINNIWFLLKEIAVYDKKLFLYVGLASVSGMLLPLATLGLTAIVIEGVSTGQNVEWLIGTFVALLVGVLVLTVLSKTNMMKLQMQGNIFRVIILNRLAVHLMKIDFDVFDGDEGQEKINKAFDTASNPHQAFQHIFLVLEGLTKSILGFLLYSYILVDIHWLFIVLVGVSSVINFLYSLHINTLEDDNKKVVSPVNRKITYLTEQTGHFQRAKDMRLYKMENWFGDIFSQLSQEKYQLTHQVRRRKIGGNILDGGFKLVIDLVAYVLLIQMIISGEISVASFTVYFGAIATLSQWISGILRRIVDLNKAGMEIDDYREFMELKSTRNHGEGVETEVSPSLPYSIEFKNVSYRYPEAETDTIKEFNLTIKPGEKMALVGVNGAGKSTLIKLLTGLYRPTEGEILINGHRMDEYNLDDYYALFSVVFQDYYELPVTIEDMVLQGKEKDDVYLNKVEKESGLKHVYQSLPKGRETKLVKRIFSDAVDLSGGQKQKLQLAKALYKNGPILILDEPTAALDSIAESEIYQQYESLSKNKTSIFISHRLASTRFCDRIVFLEDGKIIEEGTHSELMRLRGKYFDMFETQSYYYKNEVGEKQHAIV